MVCPNCARENSEQAAFCGGCGRALRLICGACGAKNPSDARYCSACGVPVSEENSPANGPDAPVGPSLCPRCGSLNEAGSLYCGDCGLPLDEDARGAKAHHRPGADHLGAWEMGRPAGFWIRTAARIIDGITIIAAGVILTALIFQENYFASYLTDDSSWTRIDTFAVLVEVAYMTVLVGALAGTVGKLLLGMRIVRTDGSRVGYWLAFDRYVAQYLSLLLLGIGYLMVAFRRDKRGLHDLICDTAVVIVKD